MLWKINDRLVEDLTINGAYIVCTIKESPRKDELGRQAIFQGNQLIALESIDVSAALKAYSDAYSAEGNAWKLDY